MRLNLINLMTAANAAAGEEHALFFWVSFLMNGYQVRSARLSQNCEGVRIRSG